MHMKEIVKNYKERSGLDLQLFKKECKIHLVPLSCAVEQLQNFVNNPFKFRVYLFRL